MAGWASLPGVTLADLAGLEVADLSPWFNPYLRRFAEDAERCGGSVQITREDGAVTGLLVSDPDERVSSIFTRSRELAASCVQNRSTDGMYSDFAFEATAEPFDIYVLSTRGPLSEYRFHHPVRSLRSNDLPAVVDLMREVYGLVNPRWFEGVPRSTEAGFVSEIDGRVAGVGWISTVGRFARLHSLTVRAPYRNLGLGSDLLRARLLWAEQAGVTEVLSEISRLNAASQALAVRSGMRRVGEIYLYRPRGPVDSGATSEAPRSSDSARPWSQ
ncbi:MAG: GNAT family N-acetyltransferase [Thermoplasmata archaeon]